jgi:hypothetical protein
MEQIRELKQNVNSNATVSQEPGLSTIANHDITFFSSLPQIKVLTPLSLLTPFLLCSLSPTPSLLIPPLLLQADDMEQQAHLVLAKLKMAREMMESHDHE